MKLRKAMFAVIVCACLITPTLSAQTDSNDARDAALKRLQDSAGGMLVVSKHKVNGCCSIYPAATRSKCQAGHHTGPNETRQAGAILIVFP